MEKDKRITEEWNGKTYISYESERAGKRGRPSEEYAATHPFPTYRGFGDPSFVDSEGRHYRKGDGFDALEFEKDNQLRTNRFWEPHDDSFNVNGYPGELQFLYVRAPIRENVKRKKAKMERLSVPIEGQEIVLIHLSTKLVYMCKIRSAVNAQGSPRESCGSVIVRNIEEVGIASKDSTRMIKNNLTSKYKKLIKV